MQRTSIGTNGINQTRIMAATQLAVFEAVNAITGEYESYLEPAIVAPAGASLDAAIVSAAHRMLTVYFPGAGAVAACAAAAACCACEALPELELRLSLAACG